MNRLLLIILPLLVLAACKPAEKIVNQDVAYLYNPLYQQLDPEIQYSHKTDSLTEVKYKINPNRILFTRDFNTNKFIGRYEIRYKVLSSLNQETFVDSDTLTLSHQGEQGSNKLIEGSFLVKTPIGNDYTLSLELADLNRNYFETYFFSVEKKSYSSSDYFISNTPKFNQYNFNHVAPGDSVALSHSMEQVNKIWVKSFYRNYPVSAPPFSIYLDLSFNHEWDSLYTIEKDSTGKFNFHSNQQGFYILQTDTNHDNGFLVTSFANHYPFLKEPNDVLQPLRLLNSNQEFINLVNQNNIKLAVDNFWISGCGSKERAREVLEKYYSRIEEANIYFTDVKEGWKTDRGIIYVIYGPPNKIFKSDGGENWYYSDENNMMSLNFTFRKVINPYSNNMYQLDRNSIYRNSWYRSVDSWREGRILTKNE